MTTTVTIEAHCSDDTEVVINIEGNGDSEGAVLQDGETFTGYVYDGRRLTVREQSEASDANTETA